MRIISESRIQNPEVPQKSMFSGKGEPNEDHLKKMVLYEDHLCNAELLFLFIKKSSSAAKNHYHLSIFLVTFICRKLVTHLWPENIIHGKNINKSVTTYIKKRTKWGPCSIVGQNMVLMRTLVLNEDLIVSTAQAAPTKVVLLLLFILLFLSCSCYTHDFKFSCCKHYYYVALNMILLLILFPCWSWCWLLLAASSVPSSVRAPCP